MRNLAPANALVRRAYFALFGAFVLTSMGLFFFMVGLALFTVDVTGEESPSFTVYHASRILIFFTGVALMIGGAVIGLRALTIIRRVDHPAARTAGEILSRQLDASYVYLRNINKRGIGRIDAILLGPHGALVLAVLDREGRFRIVGRRWMRADRRGEWSLMNTNPTNTVIEAVRRVRAYLREEGLGEVPVSGAIVFTRDAPIVRFEAQQPDVPVVYARNIPALVRDIRGTQPIVNPASVQATVNLLYDR